MARDRSLFARVIILAMLVGVNGEFFGHHKSASTELDPATANFVKMQQKQTEIDKLRKNKTTSSPSRVSSRKMIQNFVFRKFKSEIVQLFTFLPKRNRCEILTELTSVTHCNITSIAHILRSIIRNPAKLHCTISNARRTSLCTGHNITQIVVDAFWKQMGKLFHNISIPFQCSIVNQISSSLSKRHKQSLVLKGKAPRVTQMVERHLERVFPFLNLKHKCSKVWKPLHEKVPLKSPAALVNVTVQLNKGTRRKAWIRRLRKKAHQIYMIYYKFYPKTKKQRPLISSDKTHPSSPPLLSSNRVQLNIIRVTKANRSVVVVVLALELMKPGSSHYSKVSPAKLIITALKATGTSALHRLFGATVLRLAGTNQDTAKTGFKWTKAEVQKAKLQFPKYLVSYYKGLDRLERCLVMLYISSILQMDLRPVELFYNVYNVPKKYFCTSTRRTPIKTNVKIETWYRMTTAKPANKKTIRLNGTYKRNQEEEVLQTEKRTNITTPVSEISDFPEESEESEESPETRNVTPLEIGLIAVLALLCVAILAFTINCIIFALKKKSAPLDQQPNTAFAQAVFRRIGDHGNQPDVSEPHVQVALLTGDDCRQMKTKRSNVMTCSLSTQNPRAVPDVLRENDSPKDVDLNKNEYSEDPTLCSIQNTLQKGSSQGTETENSQIRENRDSDKSDSDDVISGRISPPEVIHSQHESTSSLCSSNRNCSASGDMSPIHRQATLKECSGEMKIISDSDSFSKRSLSSSGELDPVIKNNTMKVVIVFDNQ